MACAARRSRHLLTVGLPSHVRHRPRGSVPLACTIDAILRSTEFSTPQQLGAQPGSRHAAQALHVSTRSRETRTNVMMLERRTNGAAKACCVAIDNQSIDNPVGGARLARSDGRTDGQSRTNDGRTATESRACAAELETIDSTRAGGDCLEGGVGI